MKKILPILVILALSSIHSAAQLHREKYTKERPIVIVCDWDKAPYEFLDDQGHPSGSNVAVLTTIMKELDLPVKFVMKEWSLALKTFEEGDADLIVANAHRFSKDKFAISENIINYDRFNVAMRSDSTITVPLSELRHKGAVFKPGNYAIQYFLDKDSIINTKEIDYQPARVALVGILNGDYKYYVWSEEPLKWKIKELNLKGISLNKVNLPISELHIVGHDPGLVEQVDDQYSRLKQRGDLQTIQTRWMHPDQEKNTMNLVYLISGVLALLAIVIWLFSLLAKRNVRLAAQKSTELNNMMARALRMGSFRVMSYDIRKDIATNIHGDTLPPEGISFEAFASRIHPDQQEEFRQKVQRLLQRREKSFTLEKRWNAGTEENPIWQNFHGHAILELDSFGHPAYIINSIHDVTQEMLEDQVKRERAIQYERLTNMPHIALSFYDKDGWIMSMNDKMKELCGISDDNPESKRYWETVCLFDLPLIKDVFKPGSHEEVWFCQHMVYSQIDTEHFIECRITPIINNEGELINYRICVKDITADRQIDHQLHQIRKELRKTQETTRGRLTQLSHILNDSDRYLMQQDEQSGTVTLKRPSQEDLQLTSQQFQEKVDNGDMTVKNGIASDTSILHNAQVSLEEETRLANDSMRLKSEFMAAMTHELRTPLNSIVGFSGMLTMLADAPERPEMVHVLRSNTDMLQRLINDILDASMLHKGNVSIEPKPVDFSQVFNEICLVLQNRVVNPEVAFIKDNPCEHCFTTIDQGRIQQVLTNFVTNAVKFTQKGHIQVGYRQENEGLYLYCTDTGIGIPKEKQAIVFDRFVKLNEYVQGTGMGLAICKSIASSCQGKIGVESEGKGMGTTFWMWIPCEIRETETSQD